MYYVYEIINTLGTIEYVGETKRPKERFRCHKNNRGRFYKRCDVFMNIVCEFEKKNDAFNYQCVLQSEYGFITDSKKASINGKLGGKKGGSNPKLKGQDSHRALLTQKQANEIRKVYIPYDSQFGRIGLSKKYNVSIGTIKNILLKRSY